jgi:hypothetical protein
VIATSSRLPGALASCVLAFGLGSAASAATLDFTYFDRSESAAAQSALEAFQSGASLGSNEKMKSVRTEAFEGHSAWNGVTGHSDPVGANVGLFSSLGGRGTGNSAVNGGTSLQVRSDNSWAWGQAR